MFGRPLLEDDLLVLLMTFGAEDRDAWMGRLVAVNPMEPRSCTRLSELLKLSGTTFTIWGRGARAGTQTRASTSPNKARVDGCAMVLAPKSQ